MRHKLLPVLVREDRVFVAMASPTEKSVIDEIEFVTGKRVFPYVALAGPLMRTSAPRTRCAIAARPSTSGPTARPRSSARPGSRPRPNKRRRSPGRPQTAASRQAPAVIAPGQAPPPSRGQAASSRLPACRTAAPRVSSEAARCTRRPVPQVGPGWWASPRDHAHAGRAEPGRRGRRHGPHDRRRRAQRRRLRLAQPRALGDRPTSPTTRRQASGRGRQATVLVVDDEAGDPQAGPPRPGGSRLPRDGGRPRPPGARHAQRADSPIWSSSTPCCPRYTASTSPSA